MMSPHASTPHSPEGPSSPMFEDMSPFAGTPPTPTGPDGIPWKRGHVRNQSSLSGTNQTSSPSTRRRSLQDTVDLIKNVVEGKDAGGDVKAEKLAEAIVSPSRSPRE